MDITIADLTIRLLDKLCEIENQCFKQEAFTKQQIACLITDYNTIGLTAVINGEIAGFVIARVNIIRNVTFGHILTIDVAPAYRRKGVAQKLLHEIETTLRGRDIKECRLEVRENNAAALNLYQKLGYTKLGKLEKYYGDAHGLYLKKSLQ
jgi:ribosomal-protein-alanine acetyltransferase